MLHRPWKQLSTTIWEFIYTLCPIDYTVYNTLYSTDYTVYNTVSHRLHCIQHTVFHRLHNSIRSLRPRKLRLSSIPRNKGKGALFAFSYFGSWILEITQKLKENCLGEPRHQWEGAEGGVCSKHVTYQYENATQCSVQWKFILILSPPCLMPGSNTAQLQASILGSHSTTKLYLSSNDVKLIHNKYFWVQRKILLCWSDKDV